MDFSEYFEEDSAVPPKYSEVFLRDLPEEDWKRLLTIAQRRTFQPGETLVAQGEVSRTFFLVASGRLKVFYTDTSGNERGVYFVEPLSIFGEQAFFDGYPRSATVRALTTGEVFGITPEAFELLSARQPDIARIALFDLGRIMSQRLRDMTDFALERQRR
jgi:CRP/FNR family cyclic AMP-dependent transcriptional regulator